VLVLGVSYKADIDDVRGSPAEKIIQLLNKAGADVAYHDPHVPEFDGMRSVDYVPEDYDCVVIVTAHSAIDYEDLVGRADVVVDFRNATGRNGTDSAKVWKL
jgi:UDP-N-acetyl-D-glucosamine dehydrogenase